MTKREAAIVTAYTNYLIGEFDDAHRYIEEIIGHPVLTNEMRTVKFQDKIRELSRKDFLSIEITD